MLKGIKKKIYQRHYMREYRLKSRLLDPSVRPIIGPLSTVLTEEDANRAAESILARYIDADGNAAPND